MADIVFYSATRSFVAMFAATLIMHFLMPKAVLEKYFRPPYFRQFECALFTGLPYAPMRTVMFVGVIAFPKPGKKRKMTEAWKLAPRWYRIASKTLLLSIFIVGGIIFTNLGGLALYGAIFMS